jgi:hypothetical protein
MARIDVAFARYQVLAYGMGDPGDDFLTTLLAQRYGIVFRRVAGCVVSSAIVNYVTAYNRFSDEAIEQKFGREAVDSARRDAYSLAWARRIREIKESRLTDHRP